VSLQHIVKPVFANQQVCNKCLIIRVPLEMFGSYRKTNYYAGNDNEAMFHRVK